MSVVGLTIQCVGILLVMGLSIFMTRSIKRPFLNYWTIAWVCLSGALVSLSVAFLFPRVAKGFYFFYYLGEYSFGYLFFLGCQNYISGRTLKKSDFYSLGGFTAIAAVLTLVPMARGSQFVPHFAIVATLLWLAYRVLAPARQQKRDRLGLRVMSAALFLLTVDFLLYVPTFTFFSLRLFPFLGVYLGYSAVYDLILETLLGFGTIILVMEDMRLEVEAVNRELIATKEKLLTQAQLDPLTEALNRHAFYSLVDNRQSRTSAAISGCAVVIDIDNLKPINDRYGHSAGDDAIRAVARLLRSFIRADDMLFRWGGDEFLILLFGISGELVRERLDRLALEETYLAINRDNVPLIFSFGSAEFADMDGIEQAIDQADTAMYASKQFRKSSTKTGTA